MSLTTEQLEYVDAVKQRLDVYKDDGATGMMWDIKEIAALLDIIATLQQPAPDTGAADERESDYEWVIDTHDGRGNWQRKEADDGC